MNRKHSGRIGQTFIYAGKLFRMFVFRNDWKVLPMAAIIAALVSYVVSGTLFRTMEGTLRGTFALSCICIWNGFFNSIQVICRERPIIKREHRAGLQMSSYVAAHMIYQACLCIAQTAIVMVVLRFYNVQFPTTSYVFGSSIIEFSFTLFLSTYAADILALFISSLVRNTTMAMTVMPFLMIFQLIFSGGFFSLQGGALVVTNFTISKWSLSAMCAEGQYNSLPNGAILTALSKMDPNGLTGSITENPQIAEAVLGSGDISENDAYVDMMTETLSQMMKDENTKEAFMRKCGEMSYDEKFESSADNIISCWIFIIFSIIIFSVLSVISLEFIDRDKR